MAIDSALRFPVGEIVVDDLPCSFSNTKDLQSCHQDVRIQDVECCGLVCEDQPDSVAIIEVLLDEGVDVREGSNTGTTSSLGVLCDGVNQVAPHEVHKLLIEDPLH